MQERLADDHENARRLAEGLESAGYRVTHVVQTNLVIFEQPDSGPRPSERSAAWAEQGLLISPIGGNRFRAVTHYGIEQEDITRAIEIISRLAG
jgi:threonine aldolase